MNEKKKNKNIYIPWQKPGRIPPDRCRIVVPALRESIVQPVPSPRDKVPWRRPETQRCKKNHWVSAYRIFSKDYFFAFHSPCNIRIVSRDFLLWWRKLGKNSAYHVVSNFTAYITRLFGCSFVKKYHVKWRFFYAWWWNISLFKFERECNVSKSWNFKVW